MALVSFDRITYQIRYVMTIDDQLQSFRWGTGTKKSIYDITWILTSRTSRITAWHKHWTAGAA